MEGEKNNSFEDMNIFNEISQNAFIKNEKEIIKKEKDVYDYLSFYSGIVKFLNYVLLIIIMLSSTYIYIQKSDVFYKSAYLNLFCPLIMGSEASSYIAGEDCSSIKTYNTEITEKLDKLKLTYFTKIVELVPKIYELTSSNTKEKEFLISKTRDRLKVLNIIEEFEKLKTDYNFVDKNKIICKDIIIDSDNIFKANCEAYSTEWDEIVGNDVNEKISGTSISVAVSFLNYIQTKSSNFTLINKQKAFTQEQSNYGFYIYKTGFKLEMKYNGDNLSF